MLSSTASLRTRVLSIEKGDTDIRKKLNRIPCSFEFEWKVSVCTRDVFLSEITTTYFLALATGKA